MSKYSGPRLRVVRRLGELTAFTKKKTKRSRRPGQHGTNRIKLTQFAYRLVEKQKLRFYYGVSEKQLIRYVKMARKMKGSTGELLLQKLEIRLDNVVYRLGWRPTLPSARQLVNHGHILVNKKCVTVPSFLCRPQQLITVQNVVNIREKIKENLSKSNPSLPFHLSCSNETITATVSCLSSRNDVGINLKELLVIEYYSNRISTCISIYDTNNEYIIFYYYVCSPIAFKLPLLLKAMVAKRNFRLWE
jgi:small subunit ribosomal protein S4